MGIKRPAPNALENEKKSNEIARACIFFTRPPRLCIVKIINGLKGPHVPKQAFENKCIAWSYYSGTSPQPRLFWNTIKISLQIVAVDD